MDRADEEPREAPRKTAPRPYQPRAAPRARQSFTSPKAKPSGLIRKRTKAPPPRASRPYRALSQEPAAPGRAAATAS
ncbi:hypothetical protein SF12_19390, partial [Streptomyces sp. MBRL 601]